MNTAIDLSKRYDFDVSDWTLDELQAWREDYDARRKIVDERIKALTVKPKRRVTRVLNDDELEKRQASDIIYQRQDMEKMISYFLNKGNLNMAGITVLGFNTALRFGDIQKLRVADIVDEGGFIRDSIVLEEEKNKNVRRIYFNEACRNMLSIILKQRSDAGYVFASQSKNAPLVALQFGMRTVLCRQYITKQAVCNALEEYCRENNIVDHYRTHTFRKSAINLIARECSDIFRDRAYGNEAAAAFVGHKNVSTTEKHYLALSEQERRTVHYRLEVGLSVVREYMERR